MKRICAWCGSPLDDIPDTGPGSRWITHGICDDCREVVLTTMGIPLSSYLDSLPEPVLLVDGEARVLDANRAVRRVTHDGSSLPAGRLVGDVFECIHAKEPGGCGRTVHCSGCAIRRTVTDTYETGKAHLRVPATMTVSTDREPSSVQLYITTERVGDRVVLRLDEAVDEEEDHE